MVCEQPVALGVNQARESSAFLRSALSRAAEGMVVVGKQGGECSFCGEQGASASSLQTDMVIFITV